MSLLITGAKLMTMTERRCSHGELLIRNGRIEEIAEHIIQDVSGANILDLSGCIVTPGLIDAWIGPDLSEDGYVKELAMASGVTTACVDTEGEDCAILAHEPIRHNDICVIRTDELTSGQIGRILEDSCASGRRILCIARNETDVLSLLQHLKTKGEHIALVNPPNGEGIAEAIAGSGCGVIIGMSRRRSGSPWAFAGELERLGVTVAVSTNYPCAKLRLLPVCAGLCVRVGMSREAAMKTITLNPARILGLEDRGMLKEGARADLAVFDGDPLLLSTSLVMTIAGGRIQRRL